MEAWSNLDENQDAIPMKGRSSQEYLGLNFTDVNIVPHCHLTDRWGRKKKADHSSHHVHGLAASARIWLMAQSWVYAKHNTNLVISETVIIIQVLT